ncbi:hypothetical protein A3J41_02095 [candidate division TM6 bacterium RIFCSPHIGHO2_12_FULL_38_8]|nr:MAG: hypothetical protein A3J41_02095 [candidate division TM6 bacterium RIFCSPHIGHO2_12_FULL_38_8]
MKRIILILTTFNAAWLSAALPALDSRCIDNLMQHARLTDKGLFLHLQARGIVNLNFFARCLPKNWQTLSETEKQNLKTKIQDICKALLENYETGKHRTSFLTPNSEKNFREDSERRNRYKAYLKTLTPEDRMHLKTHGISFRDKNSRNFFPHDILNPDFQGSPDFHYGIVVQDLVLDILDEINEQEAEEAQALVALMLEAKETNRHNTGFAITLRNLLDIDFDNMPEPVPALLATAAPAPMPAPIPAAGRRNLAKIIEVTRAVRRATES